MNSTALGYLYTVCFLILFIQTGVSKQNESNRLFNRTGKPAQKRGWLISLQVCGVLWTAVIPLLAGNTPISVILRGLNFSAGFAAILFSVVAGMLMLAGLKESSIVRIRYENKNFFTKKFLIQYLLARVLFLCSYELFFRGLLLFTCISLFGILPAITISTLLTVLLHVFNGKKEMLGCIPFGILLCYFCIILHSVWPAIILHITLSFSYELPPVFQFITRLKPVK